MSRTSAADQDAKTQELAAEIEAISAEIIRDIAELLNATPDRELFGDTEFVVRDKVMKIVGKAFTARLAQKKTATSVQPSRAPTAHARLSSKAIATASR